MAQIISKEDQENLAHLIDKWMEESPNDSFIFDAIVKLMKVGK